MNTRAIALRYTGISNCIISEVEIKNPFTGELLQTKGIWDTGATDSVITKKAASLIGLVPVSKALVTGVHGTKPSNVYYVNITLNNDQISLNVKVTECEDLLNKCEVGMLIGMDVINMGDFSITNHDGNTIMSFRVPSIRNVDFVEDIAEYSKYLKIHEAWKKQGNDKCPCGSKKKYENCHGRVVY